MSSQARKAWRKDDSPGCPGVNFPGCIRGRTWKLGRCEVGTQVIVLPPNEKQSLLPESQSVVRDRTVWSLNVYFKRAWQGWLMGHVWSWDFVVSLCIWPSDYWCWKFLASAGAAWSHSSISGVARRSEAHNCFSMVFLILWDSGTSMQVVGILVVYGVCMWSGTEHEGVGIYSWEPGVCGRAWGFAVFMVSWGCQCWSQGDPLWVAYLLGPCAHLGRILESPMEFIKPSWS